MKKILLYCCLISLFLPSAASAASCTFKRTASAVHLAFISYGAVTFEPERDDKQDDPWLWNDGILSDDKQKYRVTWNNKLYESSWDEKEGEWKASKDSNQMPYLEYYDYLKAQENQQAMECFMRKLVHENVMGRWFWKKEGDREKIENVLLDVLNIEEQRSEKLVFYHGYCGKLAFLHDFFFWLHYFLDQEPHPIFRSRYEDGMLTYSSVDEYIKGRAKVDEARPFEQPGTVLSCNTALFGNYFTKQSYWETTLDFFFFNNNVNTVCYFDGVKKKAGQLGIDVAGQDLDKLCNEYGDISGMLKQIFIPLEQSKKLVYLCASNGHPYQYPEVWPDNFEYALDKEKIFHFWYKQLKVGIEEQKPAIFEPGTILSYLRNSLVANSEKELLSIGRGIDPLQVRILQNSTPFCNPQEAKKHGIEVFDYHVTPEKKELHDKLRDKMKGIVKGMLENALKKGTLKGGAENTKLAKLYKETGKIYEPTS